MKKRRKTKGKLRQTLRELASQPPADFYCQPVLHIDCRGQVQVENCRAILEYTQEFLRLDMGRWDAVLWGDELQLCSVGGSLLTVRGRVLKTELFYKEGPA